MPTLHACVMVFFPQILYVTNLRCRWVFDQSSDPLCFCTVCWNYGWLLLLLGLFVSLFVWMPLGPEDSQHPLLLPLMFSGEGVCSHQGSLLQSMLTAACQFCVTVPCISGPKRCCSKDACMRPDCGVSSHCICSLLIMGHFACILYNAAFVHSTSLSGTKPPKIRFPAMTLD